MTVSGALQSFILNLAYLNGINKNTFLYQLNIKYDDMRLEWRIVCLWRILCVWLCLLNGGIAYPTRLDPIF